MGTEVHLLGKSRGKPLKALKIQGKINVENRVENVNNYL